jgi:hypothetical protein
MERKAVNEKTEIMRMRKSCAIAERSEDILASWLERYVNCPNRDADAKTTCPAWSICNGNWVVPPSCDAAIRIAAEERTGL